MGHFSPSTFVCSLLLFAAARAQAPAGKPPEPFTAAGRVTTWDGQPIAGARVALADDDGPTTDEILRGEGPVTAADGTFTLPCPPDPKNGRSSRMLVFAKKGFASCLVSVPQCGPLDGARPGEPFAVGDVVLGPGTRLFGRVRDVQGTPVAGARVTARDLLVELFGEGGNGTAWCTARTNDAGIFDLPCALPSGSGLSVVADGYFVELREPVAAGAPLDVELHESGWIGGRVLADGDQGLAGASVTIVYEASDASQSAVADAAGVYRVPVKHPGRWRVYANSEGVAGAPPRSGSSALGTGAAADVRIETEAPEVAAVERKLAVRAVTKGTGAAVKTLRAAAHWGSDDEPWIAFQLSQQARDNAAGEGGSVDVAGPPDGVEQGTVYVLAEGHAPLLQREVAWTAEAPSVTVELEPEASISGVVRDAATGKPIADAFVSVISTSPGAAMMAAWAGRGETPLRTAADGTFRIGQLGAGEWDVHVAAKGSGQLPPSTVEVKAAEARTGVTIDMPAGVKVTGKLVGSPIGGGWHVLLAPFGFDPRWAQNAQHEAWSAWLPLGSNQTVAADGVFAFDGVPPGHYQLTLVLPARLRTGATLTLPVESLRVRHEDWRRDVDISSDRAHTIRGRITFSAATTPFENLLVKATPEMQFQLLNRWGASSGAHALVGPDGSFELPALDGSQTLAVFDLALGADIATTKRVVVRGGDVVHDIVVPLANVTFELKAAEGDTMACVDRIGVQCKLPGNDDPVAVWRGHMHDGGGGGRGLLLPRGATTLRLALPHGDVSLRLRNHAGRLHGGNDDGSEQAPVGTVDVQVPAAAKSPVTIEVAPPPEVRDVIERRGG